MYFVTICAAERRCIFGEVNQDAVVLSGIGELAKTCWIEIPKHFLNVKIETYIVMPNHLHGILTIDSKRPDSVRDGNAHGASEAFGKPTHNSIPTIIRSFKSAASKRVRESGLLAGEPIWQRGYYEHVLRNSREYVEATNYILLNPARWVDDEENLGRKLGTVDP